MTKVEDSRIVATHKVDGAQVRVVNHTDDEQVLVYYSLDENEVAQYGYDNVILTEDEAEKYAREYALGFVDGLEQ